MASLDDLWTLVEKFLAQTLLGETLSDLAETERTDLLEKIEIAKLPPSLPPRPEQVPDHIAKLREESRNRSARPISDNLDEGESDQLYDDINYESYKPDELDDNGDSAYEQPQGQRREFIQPAEDSDTGTSYESYDSFEDDDDSHTHRTEQLPKLPRVKSKKRLKKYGGLGNLTYTGELSCKSLFGTEQKACVIQDKKLLVFKNALSKKPQEQIDLDVYEALYFEREGKHQHVIKLKKPGGNEHWFCAENKDTANEWLQYFIVKDAEKTSLGSNSLQDSGIQSETLTHSGSEGGSGDGQVPYSANDNSISLSPGPTDKPTKDQRKGSFQAFGDKILSLTVGRKTGKNVAKGLEAIEANFEPDPDALVAGMVKVCSESMLGNKSWHLRYCQIINSSLECFKKPDDEMHEFSMSLKGLMLDPADNKKYKLAYVLSQDDKPKLYIEPPDIIEQGKWLNALIKETECGSPRTKKPSDTGEAATEDVYNDVYDHRASGIAFPRGSPPPLPKDPPPILRTPPSIKRIFGTSDDSENVFAETDDTYDDIAHDQLRQQQQHSDIDDDQTYDDVGHDLLREKQEHGGYVCGNDVTEENGDVYDDVMEHNNNKGGEKSKVFSSEVEYNNTPSEIAEIQRQTSDELGKDDAKRQVDALIKRLKGKDTHRTATSPDTKQAPVDSNVVQCTSETSIERKIWTRKDRDKLEFEISELKRKVPNIRRKRAQIRSKKLETYKASDKAKYDEELQELDKQMEETQARLAKLQLLEQEKNAASSKGSSPLASPRGSFGKGTSRTPRGAARSSALDTKSSAPLVMPVITSAKTTTTTTLRTSRVSQINTSKGSTLPNKATTEPSWRSNKSADRKSEMQTSTYSWRTGTPTTKSATLPREVTSSSTSTRGAGRGTAGAKAAPKATVQDRRKMWESIADSNC